MRNIILNPIYKLYPDRDRAILFNYANGKYSESEKYFIHPDIATFLSLFNGSREMMKSLETCDLSENDIDKLITIFSAEKAFSVKFDGNIFRFPKQVLIGNENGIIREDLRSNYTYCKPYDFKRLRMSYPKSLVLIINLACHTNCIYCYANRKHKYSPISTERLIEIINDAKKTGILDFTVSGGEFFLHKDWERILSAFIDNGYMPEISTKVPVSKEDLEKAKAIGLNQIQFSLDTLDRETALKVLRVNEDYIDKFADTIRHADELSMKITLKPTFCIYTCNRSNMESILEFAGGLKNIERVTVSTMGKSIYLPHETHLAIRPSVKQVDEVFDYLKEVCHDFYFPVISDSNVMLEKELADRETFEGRPRCSANLDGFVILPDGKVTICEELYWNKTFLIGDLTQQSIMEVWESEKALQLWNLSNEDMPETTPCRRCEEFKRCRQGQGVCWKLIMQAYGDKNMFLPDPRCPKAVKPFYDIVDR